jgi:hypothetical protein
MKNIHLLPTDKPNFGRYLVFNKENTLCIWDTELIGGQKTLTPHHIYITSDEEIKEGDKWIYNIYWDKPQKMEKDWELSILNESPNTLKIILTTDVDLIKDGVQAIDDEFLEWFVNNPSCEEVEVQKKQINNKPGSSYSTITIYKYKIIIPIEEAKQKTRVFGTEDDKSFWSDKPKQKCEHIKEYGCIKDICTCNTGPKQDPTLENAKLALREYILANKEKVTEDLQEMREKSGTGRDETLEEAAKRTYQKGLQDDIDLSFYDGVRLGANYQSERMYSEVFEWLSSKDYLSDKMEFIQKEFEQFKKE